MLVGKNVRLRLLDKDSLDFYIDFWNDLDYYGQYEPLMEQISRNQAEQRLENPSSMQTLTESRTFVVETIDGEKIGLIIHYFLQPSNILVIGYALKSEAMGKGYGTEMVQIMVDYLFLTRDVVRIEANTDPQNIASQRVLEKAGFQREGVARKTSFVRGEWRDTVTYSILREEWKHPHILKLKET